MGRQFIVQVKMHKSSITPHVKLGALSRGTAFSFPAQREHEKLEFALLCAVGNGSVIKVPHI